MTNSNAWAMLHVFQIFLQKNFKKISFVEFIKTGTCTLIKAHAGP